jgi:hypothetical protein
MQASLLAPSSRALASHVLPRTTSGRTYNSWRERVADGSSSAVYWRDVDLIARNADIVEKHVAILGSSGARLFTRHGQWDFAAPTGKYLLGVMP